VREGRLRLDSAERDGWGDAEWLPRGSSVARIGGVSGEGGEPLCDKGLHAGLRVPQQPSSMKEGPSEERSVSLAQQAARRETYRKGEFGGEKGSPCRIRRFLARGGCSSDMHSLLLPKIFRTTHTSSRAGKTDAFSRTPTWD